MRRAKWSPKTIPSHTDTSHCLKLQHNFVSGIYCAIWCRQRLSQYQTSPSIVHGYIGVFNQQFSTYNSSINNYIYSCLMLVKSITKLDRALPWGNLSTFLPNWEISPPFLWKSKSAKVHWPYTTSYKFSRAILSECPLISCTVGYMRIIVVGTSDIFVQQLLCLCYRHSLGFLSQNPRCCSCHSAEPK